MSIRLRFTLLYNAILAVTLIVFSVSLFSIQSQVTLNAIKSDLKKNSESLDASVMQAVSSITPGSLEPVPDSPPPGSEGSRQPPIPFQSFSNDQTFQQLTEKDIVRVLDTSGNLIASPYGNTAETLPLSTEGIAAVQDGKGWWEMSSDNNEHLLIYSRPVFVDGKVAYILQVAGSLSERDHSLEVLGSTLTFGSLITLLIAFGIGWLFSGYTFKPIKEITRTAQAIGRERDFTKRLSVKGPQDEVGELAATINGTLGQLEESHLQVRKSLEMQRNFVADVSHELRTPLTTLRGNLDLLKREPPIPAAEHSDVLKDMTEESDRLIRLVNQLLVLARADAERSPEKEPVQLLPLVEECRKQMRVLEPKRKIDVDVAANLTVLANRDALKQTLVIVLDNAIRHTAGKISVTTAKRGNGVEIRVKDEGRGISPEAIEHIFRRFYRAEESLKTPGFGLGLPIAQSLMEAQNGSISIESEVGRGSTVILGLPSSE
jgi:two-component system, OmpR family, sensor kinase